MTASSTLPAPNLMPLMRYRDLAEAMSWLEQAFEFEKQIAVSDADGDVIYGQMSYRGGLIMMGAVRDTDLDKLMRQPDEVGGVETQSCYLVVEDADAHYARAQAAGADVVLELKSDGLGRRGYSCRDPEGHIWNFGTYNPGKGLAMTVAAAEPAEADPPRPTPRRSRRLMSLAILLAGLGGASWWFGDEIRTDFMQRMADASEAKSAAEAEKAYAELVKVRAEKRKADETAQALAKDLEVGNARLKQFEDQFEDAAEKAAEAEAARKVAEDKAAALSEDLKRERVALEEAVEAKRVTEEKLAVKAAAPVTAAAPPPAATPAPAAAPEVQQTQAPPTETAHQHTARAPDPPMSTPEPASTKPEPPAVAAPASQNSGIETSANKLTDDKPNDTPNETKSAATEPDTSEPAEKATASEPKPADEAPRSSDVAEQDEEAESEKKPRKAAGKAAARAAAQKTKGGASQPSRRKLPAYHVDVQNVWPYNGWNN